MKMPDNFSVLVHFQLDVRLDWKQRFAFPTVEFLLNEPFHLGRINGNAEFTCIDAPFYVGGYQFRLRSRLIAPLIAALYLVTSHGANRRDFG